MTHVPSEPELSVMTDRMPPSEPVRWNPRYSRAQTEYGTVVLDGVRGRYFQLNPTATVVADELIAGRPVEEIAQVLHERFGVDLRTAQRDVVGLVEDLRAHGMAV